MNGGNTQWAFQRRLLKGSHGLAARRQLERFVLFGSRVGRKSALISAGLTSRAVRVRHKQSALKWLWALPVGAALLFGAGGSVSAADREPAALRVKQSARASIYRPSATTGALRLLTYNVAGLPGMLSSSSPSVNTTRLSPLLNNYDVVVAQEDFAYHAELVEHVDHRYQESPSYPRSTMFGDGLAVLSRFPVESDKRVRWSACNGYLLALSDCFAEKGFSVAELTLARGVRVVVVNVHGDAGHSEGDVDARRAGFAQLSDYIARHFKGRALIVAGDTNLDDSDPRDREILRKFKRATGLNEVCREFTCRGANLDRVLYRSSTGVSLKPRAWRADARFVDPDGNDLSDHLPMAAEFEWAKLPASTSRG